MGEKIDVLKRADPQNVQVGDEFFLVMADHPDDFASSPPTRGKQVVLKVEKVGPERITLTGGLYINAESMKATPMKTLSVWKGSGKRAEAFLDRHDYRVQANENALYRKLHWPGNKPRHVTREQIEQIRAILYPNG